ncbi:hypothetical protein L9F63_009213, partial [Diploptera punctata]
IRRSNQIRRSGGPTRSGDQAMQYNIFNEIPLNGSYSHSLLKLGGEELVSPKTITELSEKLLTSGIHLPGTCDVSGRHIVILDVSSVSKSSPECHQVASLLLYYSSLLRSEKLKDGFTVLILSGNGEETALDLLDKALALVAARVKIASVVLWRPTSLSSDKWQRNNSVLEICKLKCHIVREEVELHRYIAEDQAPDSCGGRANHDQLEWIEFHKELEPFLAQCQACGRRLVSIMSELRASDGQNQITRRQLHHQHRALNRILNDTDLQRLRREGNETLTRLEERAQWLPNSEDVRSIVLFPQMERNVFYIYIIRYVRFNPGGYYAFGTDCNTAEKK